jgi:hypothetical protein
VDDLSSTTGIVALAAAGVALIALVWAIVVTVQLRRLRAAQQIILGEAGSRPLVEHAADLDTAFRALRDHVEDVHGRIDDRLTEAEERIDGTLAYRGLVRFDAYNEMSGRQSTSIALLDAHGRGSSSPRSTTRPGARVRQAGPRGPGELELAPEEEEAVRMAPAPSPSQRPRTTVTCAPPTSGLRGTFSEEALLASAREAIEPSRSPPSTTSSWRFRTAAGRGLVPLESAARARSTRRSTRCAATRPTW